MIYQAPSRSVYAVARLLLAKSVADRRGLLHKARWILEPVTEGGPCYRADLSAYRGCSGWLAYMSEGAMLDAHRHGHGQPYGERLAVLTGLVRDINSSDQEVLLHSGKEIIHPAGSVHQPVVVSEFAVFLVHRPNGIAPIRLG